MPFLKIIPTAGVDASNAGAYLEAGAWAVGFVSTLFVKTDLADCRWGRITERAMELLAAVRRAKI